MKRYILGLIFAAVTTPTFVAGAAVTGPQSNFDRNSMWVHPDMNAVDVTGLATRGQLYFDTGNDIGAVDRLTEAVEAARKQGSLSADEYSEMKQTLTLAQVLGNYPGAVDRVRAWLRDNPSSAHRADMMLLYADLMLEQGATTDALALYDSIDIDALSPDLRADCLYHRAYALLSVGLYDQARQAFDNRELRESVYGNAARFYIGYVSYIEFDYPSALATWAGINTSTMPGMAADYYRSQIAYYNGNFDEAIRMARPLLTRNNVDTQFVAEANRIVGESMYMKGETTACIPYLQKYVSEVEMPERSTLYILGVSEYNAGLYAEAVKSLTPVTTDNSAMGQSAYLYIGQSLLNTGDDNGAIMAFNRALNMDFDRNVTEAAYYNYAVAQSRGAGVPFGTSVTVFEDFLTKYPDSRYANQVAQYVATGYVTDGNYEAALRSINKVSNPSDKVLAAKQKVLYLQGARLLSAGEYADAASALRQAKNLAKYDVQTATETDLLLGEALYRTGDYEGSATALLDYLDYASADNPNRAVALYDLGYTRMAQKEWAKAQLDFERLMANPGEISDATLADAQTRLGDARYYQRNWSGAAEAYRDAYSLNAATGDYPLLQMAIMQGYSRDYNGKLATLDKMLSQYPNSALVPDAMMEQAEAYTQLKQPTKSDNVYRQLIERYGNTQQGRRAYLFLAASQAGNGDIDNAIETYQSLIAQAPTSDEARLADQAVKRLHAERGTLGQYSDFLEHTDGTPSMTADEAETLTWNAAEQAYLNGKGVTKLEQYVAQYPHGNYTARALEYLLDNADVNDNDADAYKWAVMILNNYPDNSAAEYALYIKADIDYEQGKGMDALRQWEELERRASSAEYVNGARMGILRVARDMADTKRMRSTANLLLNSSALDPDDRSEVDFTLALASSIEGDTNTAVAAWSELAENPDDLYGAKAAVYAAEALNRTRQYKQAAAIAEKFVNSGTPHTYWLARGFIALSDTYMAQGRKFEAREYIKSLKDNYPGSETDIFEMIEERLK